MMLDRSQFRYVSAANYWRFDLPDKVEVLVGGSEAEPDSAGLETAGWVVEHQAAIVAEARKYLAFFIALEKLGSQGELDLGGIEVGVEAGTATGEFSLVFQLDNDIYGLWHLKFRRGPQQGPKGFAPFFFSRRQF